MLRRSRGDARAKGLTVSWGPRRRTLRCRSSLLRIIVPAIFIVALVWKLVLPSLRVGLPDQEQIEVLGSGLVGIDDVHRRGLPHTSCWVHIIGPSGMLTCKRAESVRTCPSAFASFGEHYIPGETDSGCAVRTLTEELNFNEEQVESYAPVFKETLSGWFYHSFDADKNGVDRMDVQWTNVFMVRLDTLEEEAEFLAIARPGDEEGDELFWMDAEILKQVDVCGQDFLGPYIEALELAQEERLQAAGTAPVAS